MTRLSNGLVGGRVREGSPSRGGRVATFLALVAGAAILLAACSSSSSSSAASTTTSSPSSTAAPAATATLKAVTTSYGKILETPSGQVLYSLTADTPTKAACTGACLTVWPPLTLSGTPVGGSGVTSSALGTFSLATGKLQATYDGHQLYRYAGDSAAGQVKGEGLPFPAGSASPTGTWYVVSSAGSFVKSASAAAPKSTTSTTAVKSTSGY
ncbi:MAG: COG4315 family predicted lipoprotein [Acidimicrobiales bacterium]